MTRMICNLSIAVVLCALTWAGITAQDEKKPEPKKNLMAQKLEHAQKVLAAVAQNDYAQVEKNAEELIRISKDLAWKHIRSERYEELSKEYRRELESLIKAATFKNNDAMALGYVKTSLACFNCHNHVREVKIADYK